VVTYPDIDLEYRGGPDGKGYFQKDGTPYPPLPRD
jgi:hypothetical protein